MPESAVKAYTELNGSMFHGRMFHILPGKANDNDASEESNALNFKDKKKKDLKSSAASAHNWNTLFMGANAVAEVMAKTYGKSKEEILESSSGGTNAAVRLALGETQIVLDMKQFLESHGVRLEAFDDNAIKRSKTIILAKNLPSGTNVEELRKIFAAFGLLEKIILPPSGVTCLIKFSDPGEARKAFKRLAYSKFKHCPLYLEWAPENVLKSKEEMEKEGIKEEIEIARPAKDDSDYDEPEPKSTLFIKNIDSTSTEDSIRDAFSHIGPIDTVQIAKKKVGDNLESLGYGFIQFKTQAAAEKALKVMQLKEIDGKIVELKRSDRTLNNQNHAVRKSVKNSKQKGSTKIMVRNIPFQANANEIRELFQVFGELKAVRLPKKSIPGPEQHRGFGFIDFVNKSDAKNAFEALHHSTHLYGRRLVLEWAETEQDVTEIRKRAANDLSAGSSGPQIKRSKKGLLKDEEFMNTNTEDVEDE
jgi:multiple RNA-binding domain-containing protein 1